MYEDKIKSFSQLPRLMRRIRGQKRTVAFTNGCFDLIHFGHIKYLYDSKKHADILIVGLNSDLSVRRLKGPGRPIILQKDRAYILASLQFVDYVVIFDDRTPIRLIKAIKPDFLIKGSDWAKADIVGKDFVESCKGKVITVPFIKGRSTTALIRKISRRC